jgi:hypothetical protein
MKSDEGGCRPSPTNPTNFSDLLSLLIAKSYRLITRKRRRDFGLFPAAVKFRDVLRR